MKKLCVCLTLVSLLGLGGRAYAVIGTIDAVPAATLLLPYFEVDLNDLNGVNTLFSINNASASAALAHVTVWTDQSVPAIDFDVYLTGYDVQTISVRDIFVNGHLPQTASDGQDPDDVFSPQGQVSQDINFASCSGTLPYPRPAVSDSFRAHLQAWFTGNQSPATGNCAGSKKKDGIARGYITVDSVNGCNLFFPADPIYFAGTTDDRNILWGDVIYVNPGQNFAQGETLVHIEACPTCFTAGDHTFYGRYVGGSAIDHREPLPTTMAARYVTGGGFDGGTSYLVWREGNAAASSYTCNLQGPPSWYPLDSTEILVFDEEEQPVTNNECPSGDPTCSQVILIPNEAQRVNVANDLLSPFPFGWTYLNLQHSKILGVYGDPYAQSWVTVVMDAEGRFSVGYDAIQLDNANTPVTGLIGVGVGSPQPE
jgi:hypothetical protein